MATTDTLHDLIDDNELIRLEAKEQAREIYRRIDPVRMADPSDLDFDLDLRDALHDIMLDAMSKAYQCGAEGARRISGRRASNEQLGTLLDKSVQVATYKLESALNRTNSSLDEWVAVSRAEGMDAQMVVQSMRRSLQSAAGVKGEAPARGMTLTADLLTICQGLFRRAISSASRAGQLEVFADPDEAVFGG